MFKINNSKLALCALVLTSTFAIGAYPVRADEDIISKTADTGESYCHLKFPAIIPGTLGTDHPQLKGADTGDLIDFYGPCDHNPVGKDEVESQMHDQLIRGLRNYGEE
jgi:hypothetical protein